MKLPAFRDNGSARAILEERNRSDLDALAATILERVRSVDPQEANDVERELEAAKEHWRSLADGNASLVFSNFKEPMKSLMVTAGESAQGDQMETLRSLRDVDLEASLRLIP